MSTREIARRRLLRQHLVDPGWSTAAEVVRGLVAAQSQEYPVATWSLGRRTTGRTEAEVRHEFDTGAVLRTHVLRPTWHFVHPDDLRWLLDLTAPRVHALNAYYYRTLGVADLFGVTEALLVRTLADGIHRTRAELAAVFAAAGIEAAGLRLAYLLMHAELTGLICSGAMRGRQHTYALLDERAPGGRRPARDEALAELVRRYFTGHGPATAADLAWWSGLTRADVRAGIDLAGPALDTETVDGLTFYRAGPERAAVDREVGPVAHLVQGYDETVVGYSSGPGGTRGAVHVDRTGGTHRFLHLVFLDGQLIGSWRRVDAGRASTVETDLYQPPDAEVRAAVEPAVADYGRFLGRPVTWSP